MLIPYAEAADIQIDVMDISFTQYDLRLTKQVLSALKNNTVVLIKKILYFYYELFYKREYKNVKVQKFSFDVSVCAAVHLCRKYICRTGKETVYQIRQPHFFNKFAGNIIGNRKEYRSSDTVKIEPKISSHSATVTVSSQTHVKNVSSDTLKNYGFRLVRYGVVSSAFTVSQNIAVSSVTTSSQTAVFQ
jgi:hypothetical protein